MTRRMRWPRRIAVLVVPFLFFSADNASAYFSVTVNTGTNYALAHATSLTSPTTATATATGATSITVGWTLPGSQLPGAQYVVSRTAPTTATVCTVTAASGTHACSDTGLAIATTYTYSITASLSSWQTSPITASTATATPSYSITLSAGPYTAGSAVTVQTIRAMVGASTDITYTGVRTITWSGLATSPAPASRAPSYPSSTVTFIAGVASPASAFTAYTSGANTLTATDSAATGVTGSANISVVAAAINRFVVSASPSAVAGTAVTGIALSAHDAYDNVATSYTGTKTITWSGPATSPAPTSAAPTLPATSVAFTSGNSTTALNATLRAAGSNTLTATEAGGKTGSATITVTSAAASAVAVVSGSGVTETVSNAFPSPLVASVKDAYSNPVPSASVVFTAPASGASGKFANNTITTTVVANASGVATATTFTANATVGGPYNVTATSGTGSAAFSLTNTAPLAVTGITSTNVGGTVRRAETGDTFSVTFNNALNPATIAATGTITLVGAGSSTTVTISGLTNAAGFVMPSNYEKSGNTSSATGTLALSNGNKTITFTITGAFSNAGNLRTGSAGAFTFTALATIADTSGSSAAPAFAQPSLGLW